MICEKHKTEMRQTSFNTSNGHFDNSYYCSECIDDSLKDKSEVVQVRKEDLQKWAKIRNAYGVDYELEMFKAQIEMNKYLGEKAGGK